MRFLILLALIYAVYRLARSLRRPGSGMRDGVGAADEMIKDPICQVYFPKRTGVVMHLNGETFYFCSKACQSAFEAKHSAQG